MEENLMEKLLSDFNGTLNEFNELVKANDYDGVKRVLDEVNRLIQERDGIVLDDREPQYDHVLHELLDKMTGIVEKEITVEGIDGIKGSRYYTNDEIQKMIDDAEKELKDITRLLNEYKYIDDSAYAQARSERSHIIVRISELRAGLVPGQEFSSLTYIDPNVAELQENRAKLLEEKQAIEEEIGQKPKELSPEEEEELANAKVEKEGLLKEIDDLKEQRDAEVEKINSEIRQVGDPVFSGIDDTHNPQVELERIANELGIEPSELRIEYHDGATDYGDNVATEFDIVRVEKVNEPILTSEERDELENELAELQAQLDKLNENEQNVNDVSIDELRSQIQTQITALTDEIVANNESYANTDRRMEANEPLMAKRAELQAQIDSLNELVNNDLSDIDAQIQALTDEIVANNETYANTDRRMEANEPLMAKRAELQAQRDSARIMSLDDIDAQITALTDEIVANNESYANTDRRMEANEPLMAKRSELQAKRDLLNKILAGLDINTDSKTKEDLTKRINEINGILDVDNQRIGQHLEVHQLDDQIMSIELRITEIEVIINKFETQGRNGNDVDNSEKIAELLKRKKELEEKIAGIDKEISEIPGTIPTRTSSTQKEMLDVEKEAHRIGDHIFKTATIRRELASRNVTREEFLEFYKTGLDMTTDQIESLGEEYKKYLNEIGIILTNPENSNVRIDKQIESVEKEGDTEALIKLNEQLRKNFIKAGREEQLKEVGLDDEITSLDSAMKMKAFYTQYKDSVETGIKNIKSSVEELKENAGIFATEIERINVEKATLEKVGNSVEELQNNAEARKKLRRDLLEASITPEKELTDEQKDLLDSWQKASERFLSKKTTKEFNYMDKDNNIQTIEVDTIDTRYPEYEKDVEFLGVEEYKSNLEQVSAWNKTKDPYVFGQKVAKAYESAEAEREGAGEEVINRILADKQKYVETFNGIPNPHKVKYENWKTAGSTLKSMQPVSSDLPISTRTKNAAGNVARFFGFRMPKFTKLDEHGNEVRDVFGGIGTIATDALVGGMIIATPALMATAYAAKGIVVAGNKIAARVEYARHKDEIDNNKPVINQADSNAREVARKEYYREQGDNRFISWVKAKSDKYFTKNRGLETELAIVDKLADEYAEAEDKRVEGLKENIEIANANQEARLRRQEQIAMGANTYNDIVRDPDSIDMDKATEAIARNAALESVKTGRGKEDVNANSTVERRSQYVKQEKPVAKTSDLNKDALDVTVEAPVSALTEEQIYTGRKQKVDRINKVLVALTTGALRFGYNAWKDGFVKEEVIHHDAEYKEELVHHDAEVTETEVPDFETRIDTSKTLDEIMKNSKGKQLDGHYSVSGGIRGTQARTINGEKITAAWVDNGSKYGTGISDAQGLTAPVLTDRLAEANLIDASGVLRQDITVDQILEATGATPENLANLDGVYVSVGDKYWASLKDLMGGMTKEIQVGSHIEQVVTPAFDETVKTLVKDAFDETVKTFDSGLVVDAIKDGVLAGAAMGAGEQLHEAFQNTYINGATPGRPEEVTPEAKDTFDTIANKLFEQTKKEKQIKQEEKDSGER